MPPAPEFCFSSMPPAPFVAQLQRICLLPSHLPERHGQGTIMLDHTGSAGGHKKKCEPRKFCFKHYYIITNEKSLEACPYLKVDPIRLPS